MATSVCMINPACAACALACMGSARLILREQVSCFGKPASVSHKRISSCTVYTCTKHKSPLSAFTACGASEIGRPHSSIASLVLPIPKPRSFQEFVSGLYCFACTSVAPNNYNSINIAQRTPYHTLLCSLGEIYLSSEISPAEMHPTR